MEPYDIFIPVAPKDLNKLPFLVKSIEKNLSGYSRIFVSSPVEQIGTGMGVISVSDSMSLYIKDISRFKYRPNWIYQQYMKLFQDVTECDLFMTIDSDVIINRPLRMFEPDGRRIIWMGWEQNHRQYFEFQEKLLGLPRIYAHTFINDTNFFSKSLIREMLAGSGFTVESFIEKSVETIDPTCYPAEPEIFGQYVHKHHPEKYSFRQAKTKRRAKTISQWHQQTWSDGEINAEIEAARGSDIDFLMLHSWFTNNEAQ